MLYCEAKLLRAGLANRLLPWARCRIFSQLHGVPMLAPRWAQVPIGATVLRRRSDLRTYTNLFTRREGDISGWRRTYVRLRASRIAEPERLSDAVPPTDEIGLVTFEGLKGQFQQLHGWHEFIRRELFALTMPVWREKAEAIPRPFIGIHVRRGDFQRPNATTNLAMTDNMSTPLSWFIESLKSVRAHIPATVPAVVTSDGTLDELRALLDMDNIRLVSTGSAVGDLLALSRASLLLASGSTFSAWASYLGQMPTLSHPGQNFMRMFRLECAADSVISEFDPSNVPPTFFENLPVRFNHGPE